MSYNQIVGGQNPNVWIRGEAGNTDSGLSAYPVTYGAGITYGGEGVVDRGMSYTSSAAITFPYVADPPAFTISGWYRPMDTNVEFARIAYSADQTQYVAARMDSAGMVSLYDSSQGTSFSATTAAGSFGYWNHIVIRSSTSDPYAGGYDLFVNGVKSSGLAVNNFAFQSIISLGKMYTGTGVAALFDEMAFWNRSLTDGEILAQYNSSYGAVILSQTPADYLPYGTGKNAVSGGTDWSVGTTQSSSPLGIFGRAMVGNTADTDYIRKVRTGNVTTQTFWIKTTTANTFIMQYRNSTASTSWALYLAGGKVQYGSTLTSTRGVSTTSVNDGNWHHVALNINQTNDTNRLKIYVDGVQEYTGNIATITSTTVTMDIMARTIIATNTGATTAAAPNFTGLLDEVAYFDRALTPAEIAAQYAARPQTYTPPTQVNAKVTAPVATVAFNGTTNNNAYQYMDTTSVSGYKALVLSTATPIWYTDGLSGTNLGTVGGSFTSIATTFQSQGKFTGGISVGTSSPSAKGSVSFVAPAATGDAGLTTGFWFKAGYELYNRQIWSLRNNIGGIVEELTIQMDGKLYYTSVSNAATALSATAVTDGKWHFVVVNQANTGRQIWLDSVQTAVTRGVIGTANLTAYISSNNPTDGLAMTGSIVMFDEWFTTTNANGLTQAQVNSLYNFKETKQTGTPGTFGLFGTTNNNVAGVKGVRQVITAATIGFNGTANSIPRVNNRIIAPVSSATFNGVNANISSTRIYRFSVTAGTFNAMGTTGNRGYTPLANNKAEPAYSTWRGVNANVYAPVSKKITAPVATISFSGVAGVAKTRTDRTVSTAVTTALLRGLGAKLKVNGDYVDNFNTNNRWYKQIRATHIAKNPAPSISEDYKLGTSLQWYKFEGTEAPYLAAAGANGASTGVVEVVGDYQLGIDAGHTRSGIKLRNGGYFKSRVTYPFLIPGAQQQLLGGLRTHYTAEFAFRAYGAGALCTGVRINAGGKLEFLQANGYWYELRTEYPNLLDGQWHHVIFISPQSYFVPPESNPDRNFVVVDGKVVSAVHAPVYVPSTWAYDSSTGANNQIDFDDIVIDMFRIISVTEAAKLYYEYSEAVIVSAGSPARATFNGTNGNKPKGNVQRVLALYGSPAGYTTNGGEVFKYMNEYSSFKISDGSEAQISPSGFQNDGGRGKTFRYNGMLVFPVSYTAKNASAEGVLDTNRATYVDDKTGYTRLIDFDNDFAVDPADFDIVTVVRWPSLQDSLVTRPFLTYTPGTGGGYLGNQAPPAEPNDIVLARKNTIEKFALGLLKLANKGVHIWVQDPATGLGLGLISGYTDDQDRLTERTEDDGVLNQGARNTELQYGKTPVVGTLGSPGYADTGHNIWKRRITATVPGLTDVSSWATIDSIEWRDLNPFAAHAVQYRRKYNFFASLIPGDEFAVVSDGNTGLEYYYTKGFVTAEPTGYIGTPISRGQNVVSTKAGTFVSNPYKDRILSLAVDAGTTIKGIKINARIFAEFNEKLSQPYVLMGNDKNYQNGRPLLANEQPTNWDYDSTRENQIVANYALERFRDGLYIGAEAQPYIVYGNGVPSYFYTAIDMHTRGLNWLKAYVSPNPGDVKVTATAATVNVKGTQANTGRAIRNTKISAPTARVRFEFTMPKNFQNSNARVSSFPGSVSFNGVDIQAIVKASVATIVVTASNTKTTGQGEDIVLYYSNWAPALYKEDI